MNQKKKAPIPKVPFVVCVSLIAVGCGLRTQSEGTDRQVTDCSPEQGCTKSPCKAHGEVPLYSPGDDMAAQCCAGTMHVLQKRYFDADCKPDAPLGYAGICIACGDGTCDSELESECNCPDDCDRTLPPPKDCAGLGEESYHNVGGISCCSGLTPAGWPEWFDESCGANSPLGGWPICIACGDGACDTKLESECNCPEDCASFGASI